MTFRARNILPNKGLAEAQSLGISLADFVSGRSVELLPDGTAQLVLDTLDTLVSYSSRLTVLSQTPNIGQFARDQENDPSYDVVAELTALISLIDAAIAVIISTVPQDGAGFLLFQKRNAAGVAIDRTFTGATLAGLRNALGVIDASIV